MSELIKANSYFMYEFLLDKPTTLSESNKKRWSAAFVTIYCARAFSSRKNDSKVSPVPSHRVVKDVVQSHPIDQSSLTKLVKEKKLDQLIEFGGVNGIASSLKSDVQHGIQSDVEDISRRHETFGTNTYQKPPTKRFFHFVWDASKNRIILILILCAAVSLGLRIKEHGPKERWYDGASIFVAVFVVIAVSAVRDYWQNRQFEKLSKASNNTQVEVVRSGRPQQISKFEIVVGDVVCLRIGDQVPADGLFLDGHSLQVDEYSMTGESDQVEVNHNQNPFLFSGTKVVDGYARMLVTSVGMNTTWGEMMSKITRDAGEQTPLQARLNNLTSSIGKVGLAVAFLVLLVLLVRYFTGNIKDANGKTEFNGCKTKVVDVINAVGVIIAAAVNIVVVTIPEGLPLVLTLILASSTKRMMADQVMVRKLSACETMGSVTTICTEKTGTLTMNQMKVMKFWLGQESMQEMSSTSTAASVLELLHQGVGLNTTGSVYKSTSDSKLEFSGSPTEKAILSWAVLELDMDMEELKESCAILHVEAFNSEKKRSGILMKKNADNKIHVHWKGAAEMILAMCSHYYDPSGNTTPLNDIARKKFDQIIQGMAASSLRCIAFAHKQVQEDGHDNGKAQQKIEDSCLTLLGLVGIKDPCRPGVKNAVQDCQNAGVNIKMITGDNVFTATAIATECGILTNHYLSSEMVVEGIEFRNYTPEERMEKVEHICVMARSSPLDKLLMVQCLEEKGHVVAVISNGTKEANIGLSMAIQSTESSDIVILDDNFTSVVTVLRWGRCVCNNTQKFIQFQLTVNVAALVLNFAAAVLANEVPLTAAHFFLKGLTIVQLLWTNLIMDTLVALALATERPTKEIVQKPPKAWMETLITNIMWRNLIPQALYQIVVLLILQFKGESIFNVNQKVNNTLIFNTFVLCQVFNVFNARKLEKKNIFEGIHRNMLFLGIIGITIVLQVMMVEFLKRFADTERLNLGQWGACIGIAAISWPIGWVVKCIPVPNRPFFSNLKWQKLKLHVQ